MPRDPIYRTILLLLGLDAVAGAVLMLLGHYRFHDQALVDLGAGLGVAGGLLYLFFRWWGRRRLAQRDDDRRTG
ncbi:hypothetical protein SAMN06265365_102169 [Tistlia consotensis]|uniref:Uncharacterized protein n=1 Tax=Tistlia consotensis USBA 355 TaxID=560819 RepID=A0A1Y6BL04_9PROT|nr:hypothetical protein [Tistlia consotensis]SMF08641.1 hypothetical protein SAMN05428998_104147 [Tistlia consotensis USBA 355]SNR35295.1 hypothetical protein SAMN06265365_102169 [Tistlia consotensis]